MDVRAAMARTADALPHVELRVATLEIESPGLPGDVAPGQLTSLLAQLPAVAWTLDLNSRVTFSWGGALARLGLTPGQIVGKSLAEYFGFDDPEWGPFRAHRMAARGLTVSYELPWAEGVWRSIVRPLRNSRGEIVGVLGLALDVSPQVRARSALEGERDALELIARGAPLEQVLASLCSALERQSDSGTRACVLPLDPLRMVWGKAIGPRLPRQFLHAFDGQPAVDGRGACATAVWRKSAIVVEDVARHPLTACMAELVLSCGLMAYVTVPIIASDGTSLGTFALYRSQVGGPGPQELLGLEVAARTAALAIEQRRAAESLASHARQLERSNTELERFAYVSSHDLQEPLRTVASFSQLLARRLGADLEPPVAQCIDTITEAVSRMQRLIDDLLAYSRIGSERPQIRAVDSGEMLAQAISDLHATIAESGAAIERGELPTVAADPALLRTVFQNLLSNAVKFRGSRPPRIVIDARREGDEWVFAVKDEGIGIDAEQQPQLFKLFYRVHDRLKYPGNGVGLATCNKIVERLAGRMWVESTPGLGSTFSFSLPAADAGLAAS
jgi:signal transduction histidine kinase